MLLDQGVQLDMKVKKWIISIVGFVEDENEKDNDEFDDEDVDKNDQS